MLFIYLKKNALYFVILGDFFVIVEKEEKYLLPNAVFRKQSIWRWCGGRETKLSWAGWKTHLWFSFSALPELRAQRRDRRLSVINPAAQPWFHRSHVIILCEATQFSARVPRVSGLFPAGVCASDSPILYMQACVSACACVCTAPTVPKKCNKSSLFLP